MTTRENKIKPVVQCNLFCLSLDYILYFVSFTVASLSTDPKDSDHGIIIGVTVGVLAVVGVGIFLVVMKSKLKSSIGAAS